MPAKKPDPHTTPGASEGFEDAQEFFDGPLRLPVLGKVYTIPQVGIELGLTITGVFTGKKTSLSGKPTMELYKRLLGPVWDELLADGVPMEMVLRVGETAMVDFTQDRDTARLVWKYGVSPEALAAAKAATPKQTADTQSTPAAAAAGTRSRASTNGTKARRSR